MFVSIFGLSFGTLNAPAAAIFFGIAAIYGAIRPSTIRDSDGLRLPASIYAAVFSTLIYSILYAVLTTLCYVAGVQVRYLLPSFLAKLFDDPANQAPLFGFLAFAYLLRLGPVAQLEIVLHELIHGIRHRYRDMQQLAKQLRSSSFVRNPEERRKAREGLRKFGVYLKGDDYDMPANETVSDFERGATLLFLLKEWVDVDEGRVDTNDLKLLEELKQQHDRIGEFAIAMCRFIGERTLTQEDQMAELLKIAAKYLDLSIGNRQLFALAAKTVIYSDKAYERLNEVQHAGFQNIDPTKLRTVRVLGCR